MLNWFHHRCRDVVQSDSMLLLAPPPIHNIDLATTLNNTKYANTRSQAHGDTRFIWGSDTLQSCTYVHCWGDYNGF